MQARQCARCGQDTYKEYILTLQGGRRPKNIEAWLYGDACAEIYFNEKVNS